MRYTGVSEETYKNLGRGELLMADGGRRDRRNLWDKIWRNRQGDVVIFQMPNIPLIAWAVFTILSLATLGHISDVFTWIGSACLVIWCLLEIFKGANYFRRVFGLAVLVFAVIVLSKSL